MLHEKKVKIIIWIKYYIMQASNISSITAACADTSIDAMREKDPPNSDLISTLPVEMFRTILLYIEKNRDLIAIGVTNKRNYTWVKENQSFRLSSLLNYLKRLVAKEDPNDVEFISKIESIDANILKNLSICHSEREIAKIYDELINIYLKNPNRFSLKNKELEAIYPKPLEFEKFSALANIESYLHVNRSKKSAIFLVNRSALNNLLDLAFKIDRLDKLKQLVITNPQSVLFELKGKIIEHLLGLGDDNDIAISIVLADANHDREYRKSLWEIVIKTLRTRNKIQKIFDLEINKFRALEQKIESEETIEDERTCKIKRVRDEKDYRFINLASVLFDSQCISIAEQFIQKIDNQVIKNHGVRALEKAQQ